MSRSQEMLAGRGGAEQPLTGPPGGAQALSLADQGGGLQLWGRTSLLEVLSRENNYQILRPSHQG